MYKNLADIISQMQVIQVAGNAEQFEVAGVSIDSREVKPSWVFVARKGYKTDGHNFVQAAINNGAVAVILDDKNAVSDDIFSSNNVVKILVADSGIALAEFSSLLYNNPSSRIKLIGITGTKGKTTTTFYVKNILEHAGEKVGVLGTIANYIGDTEIGTKLTTPESYKINELLDAMIKDGCSYCVMEVSSHALSLHRVSGLEFDVIAFTNITSDHLDFHKDFEAYREAKKILFDEASTSTTGIVNIDDESWSIIAKDFNGSLVKFGKSGEADYRIKDVEYDLNGTSYKIESDKLTSSVSTDLIGEFNAYNSGIAAAICIEAGVNSEVVTEGIETIPQVPGRFEVLHGATKKVIIDYSHTTDSLKKALEAIHEIVTDDNMIISVMGCGGDRDKSKRPVMGKTATSLSSFTYVTSDNPRTEDPFAIISDIEKGIETANYKVIENRELAIKSAIEESPENSVILVAGKGHETYQEINGVRHHFSDKDVALKYLNKGNVTITIEDIFEIPSATIYEPDNYVPAKTVVTDSRIATGEHIFCAIEGERFDAHDFIHDVVEKGVKAVIVNKSKIDRFDDLDITLIAVENTIDAYAFLAGIYLKKLGTKVISITGSNGKTSTKEILADILGVKYRVHKTEANNNNHIGVPKTIYECTEENDFCVLEHGTNHFGEIEFTAKVANPEYSLITNIGDSHTEYLENREGVLKEKYSLFEATINAGGTIFVNNDDFLIAEATKNIDDKITFGFSENCDVSGEDLGIRLDGRPRIGITYKGEKLITGIPLYGRTNMQNVLAASAIALYIGLTSEEVEKGIANLKPVKGRLDVTHYENFTMIDDTYNANPVSVLSSLEVLEQLSKNRNSCAFLGDMFELGGSSEAHHKSIADMVIKHNVNEVVLIGANMKKAYEVLQNRQIMANIFENYEAMKNFIDEFDPEGKTILVKGSRGMKMERVIDKLVNRNN